MHFRTSLQSWNASRAKLCTSCTRTARSASKISCGCRWWRTRLSLWSLASPTLCSGTRRRLCSQRSFLDDQLQLYIKMQVLAVCTRSMYISGYRFLWLIHRCPICHAIFLIMTRADLVWFSECRYVVKNCRFRNAYVIVWHCCIIHAWSHVCMNRTMFWMQPHTILAFDCNLHAFTMSYWYDLIVASAPVMPIRVRGPSPIPSLFILWFTHLQPRCRSRHRNRLPLPSCLKSRQHGHPARHGQCFTNAWGIKAKYCTARWIQLFFVCLYSPLVLIHIAYHCILASALSLAPQGEIDRARIAELTSQLTSAANDNDKLKEKLRDVVADRNRLHDECMMHNAGGLAVLSGEVPARRRCWP